MKQYTSNEGFILRSYMPGDIGWIIHRHGILYAMEYGWDNRFEALIAHIAADFVDNYNPQRERCIIAEMNGEIVGSIFIVQSDDENVSKLRLFLVEPQVRRLGLGNRLVEECISFAKSIGYQKIMLWTNDVLVDARKIYEKAGFLLVSEEKHHSFGKNLIGQTWELKL